MNRHILCVLCIVLGMAVAAVADEKQTPDGKQTLEAKASDTKTLSGMSIVGNDEAPKSLYIVPWKSSEIGVETSLNMTLNDQDGPVDREVFRRQLEFYRVRTAKE